MKQAVLLMSLYFAVLFFVLSPGVLLSLPPGSSTKVQAATHSVVFALVYLLTHKLVWNAFSK